jgi:ribosomal protein S18 acetylase RimI-like enzyme
LVDWDEPQKTAFLKMQFNAQHHYYQEYYGGASFQIIVRENEPIGRLYVARWDNEIRIIDITLLPDYCNQGIGSFFLKELLAEGGQKGLPVRIHVEMYNRAIQLYYRLGFRKIGEHGVYWLMEWTPLTVLQKAD